MPAGPEVFWFVFSKKNFFLRSRFNLAGAAAACALLEY
jgi:hypothetical protein